MNSEPLPEIFPPVQNIGREPRGAAPNCAVPFNRSRDKLSTLSPTLLIFISNSSLPFDNGDFGVHLFAVTATSVHKMKTNTGLSSGRPAMQVRPSRTAVVPNAIFTKQRPATVVEEAKPEKKPFSLFGGKTKPATATKPDPKQKVDKAAEYKKRQGIGGVISAFDFAETRSKSDAELLYDAKYGQLKDGKMTREQYQALRRKIGGTAKDFWKTSIDVKGEYTDKGYVSTEATTVPGLPFLVGTCLALLGTVVFVVAQTAK